MKFRNLVLAVTATAMAFGVAAPSAAAVHTAKYSKNLHAFRSGCVFFQLEGVTVADSSVSSTSDYFALATNHPNFNQLYALLLSANLARRTITLNTDGGGISACSQPSVLSIQID